MNLNTLHAYMIISNFHVDRHFIYITTCKDETKEELQSYYKLTDEGMEKITKEWSVEFLVPVEQTDLSNPDIIRVPMVTREEYDGHSSSKKKKKEEVQEINNASEETASESPGRGGADKVDQKEDEGEEDKK
jgi:hypothetical protein